MATNTHAIFEDGIMVSSQLDSYLRNGNAHADLDNGWVVTATVLVSGEKDLYTTAYATDVTTDKPYIVDGVVRVLINGKYAMDEIHDHREFYTPSGKPVRLRRVHVGDTCYITATGYTGTPVADKYLIPANGTGKMAVADNLTGATTIAFLIKEVGTEYIGQESVVKLTLECVVAW
jgi:hypothetical protein